MPIAKRMLSAHKKYSLTSEVFENLKKETFRKMSDIRELTSSIDRKVKRVK